MEYRSHASILVSNATASIYDCIRTDQAISGGSRSTVMDHRSVSQWWNRFACSTTCSTLGICPVVLAGARSKGHQGT